MTVTLKWNSTDANAAATFRISSLETFVEPGIYIVRNEDTEGYLDIVTRTMQSGTLIDQKEFDGTAAQRWEIQYLSEGYYSIRSMNSLIGCYLGVSGDGTATETPVVLRSAPITNGMKWKISTTSSGAYKITPATGETNDRVLAVSFYVPLFGIGTKVRQRDYVDDTNYKDEWYLLS